MLKPEGVSFIVPNFQTKDAVGRARLLLSNISNCVLALILSTLTTLFNLTFFNRKEILKFGYTENFTGIAKLKSNFPRLNSSLYLDTGSNFSEFSSFPVYPNTFREPLYPLFLKITHSLFEFEQIIWIQRFLMLVSIFLIIYLCLEKYGKAHSLILFLAINLLSSVPFFYSQLLYPYALSFVLTTFSLFVFVRGKGNWTKFALPGFLMGLVTLERQQVLLFPVALFVLVFIRYGISISSIRKVLGFIAAFLIAISPTVTNGLSSNYLGISSSQGYALGYGFGADVSNPENGCIDSKYLSSYSKSVIKYGADSGSLHFLGSQVVNQESTIALENSRLSNAIIQCIKSNPRILVEHSIRNSFHLSERLITPRNPFKSKNLGEYWDNYISMKPRFGNPTTLPGLIFTGFVLFQLIRRFRKIDSFELFTLALIITTGVVSILTIYDPRYRINLDWLLFTLAIKYVLDFFIGQNIYRRIINRSRR